MIRVLHVYNYMSNGGIEHFVMDRFRLLDRTCVCFDFIIASEEAGYFDEEIRTLGGKVYHVPPLTRHPLSCFGEIRKIVSENHYDIVHCHSGNAIAYYYLRAARSGGAEHLILHSHNNSAERLLVHRISKIILSFDCIRFACSEAAGTWLFGRKPFSVIPNAIDVRKFVFCPEMREKTRQKLGLGDSFVIGHIGRFDGQKNQSFLVDIFHELCLRRPNSRLLLIGDGPRRPAIQEKAEKLGLGDKVLFTGTVDNVNDLIHAFDCFCLPSNYEGFPFTLLEAQVNGLSCFASRDRVPEESNLSGNVEYISLQSPPAFWAEEILTRSGERDLSAPDRVRQAGYDLPAAAEMLQKFYEGL